MHATTCVTLQGLISGGGDIHEASFPSSFPPSQRQTLLVPLLQNMASPYTESSSQFKGPL